MWASLPLKILHSQFDSTHLAASNDITKIHGIQQPLSKIISKFHDFIGNASISINLIITNLKRLVMKKFSFYISLQDIFLWALVNISVQLGNVWPSCEADPFPLNTRGINLYNLNKKQTKWSWSRLQNIKSKYCKRKTN